MEQFKVRNGTSVVVSSRNDSTAPWASRLYRNNGQTATLIAAKHRKMHSAFKWAERALGL